MSAVEAALLVDDRSLVTEFITWHTSLLSSHGFANESYADLLRGLSSAPADLAPTACGLLNS
ncbi:MAG: hypothetical protein ACXW15_06985 [Acidimicrobiia bacterium]